MTQKSEHIKRRELTQKLIFGIIRLSAASAIIALIVIIGDIVIQGYSVINIDFITKMPTNQMTEGGILPCILGTAALVALALLFAVPLGVAAAIYLTEYASDSKIKTISEQAVNNLAGTPSVIFGLFGLALFIKYAGLPMSLLTASLTTGLLIVPVIIRTSQEALLSVPKDYRNASYALGATQWETIRCVILPSAFSGMITGIIISIGRAAGETAPILFTGAVYYYPRLPDSVLSPFMALPYHLFVMASESLNPELTQSLQYGTALVLLIIVFSMNLTAFGIRRHYKRKSGMN